MRLLSINHQRDAGPGVFAEAIAAAGAALDQWFIAETPTPPADPAGYDAVMSFGGSMDVDQEDLHPWLPAGEEAVGGADRSGAPRFSASAWAPSCSRRRRGATRTGSPSRRSAGRRSRSSPQEQTIPWSDRWRRASRPSSGTAGAAGYPVTRSFSPARRPVPRHSESASRPGGSSSTPRSPRPTPRVGSTSTSPRPRPSGSKSTPRRCGPKRSRGSRPGTSSDAGYAAAFWPWPRRAAAPAFSRPDPGSGRRQPGRRRPRTWRR